MAEEILDDQTRNEILGAIFKPKVQEAKPAEVKVTPVSSAAICECGHEHTGKCSNKYCSCTEAKIVEKKLEDFGTLLEQSLQKRLAIDESETKLADEAREQILQKVNTDFIKGWRF